MEFQNILTDTQGSIQTITINRPNQLNALNKQTIEELSAAFTNAEADAETRVIIIIGAGEKAFVAGADIKEFANFNVEQGAELARRYDSSKWGMSNDSSSSCNSSLCLFSSVNLAFWIS